MEVVVVQEVRSFPSLIAVVEDEYCISDKTIAVEEEPVPKIGDNALFIQVEYAAVKPT